MRVKEIFTHWRIIVLIIALILAVVAINPAIFGADGVAIRNVEQNSSAYEAGMRSPEPGTAPRSREVITQINNEAVTGVQEYYDLVSNLDENQTVSLRTNQDTYLLDASGNGTLGLTVYDAPWTNIRKGLDLTGGTRVILEPQGEVSEDDMQLLIENIKERLNVYGLSDVVVRQSSDLQGNQFVIAEIAGATEEEVSELIARQGRFEARIGNTSVFQGGDDVTYVCRSADCSGIDPQRGCSQQNGMWSCGFYFQINVAPEAAERQAKVTENLTVVNRQGGQYLSKPIDLFLDGEQVDSLQISASLQGRPVTEISITGGGNGTSRQRAVENTLGEMEQLQTVLITGSLPVDLEIARVDTISPVLGEEFTSNALLIGGLAILAVALTVLVRYRSFIISIPMSLAMLSEAVLILGVASLIGWNLDLAAIAGIIIAIGTGVDDQIIIADETHGTGAGSGGWDERLSNAFFIIFAAYFTLVVAMLPLMYAGAGLLRGFAITTILGVSVGVFITRPAYAVVVEKLSRD